MTEVLDCRALVFGSPTLNNGILPRMADFLTYLKGLRPKGKVGAAFGSFGWSGEAVKHLNTAMAEMDVSLVDEGLRVKNVPKDEDFVKCKELGKKIGQAVLEMS
jgi:flavorubredoxin